MEGLAVMEYIIYAFWAVLDLLYDWLMISPFLGEARRRDDTPWFMILAWLFLTGYTCVSGPGLFLHFARLLVLVVMVIYLFGETGTRGLGAIAITFGVSLLPELVARYVAASGTTEHYAVFSFAKLGVLLAAWLTGRYLATHASRRQVRELEELLQRQHMEMQTESINALEHNYRQQRRVTHDFEHHLQVLDNLLSRGAVADAQDYIRQLRSSRSYRTISVNSRHSVIDVILNQKYQTAKESGIKMQLQVNDLSGVTVLTESLVVILSNLLDNAIEACHRLDGYREIDCSVLLDDSLYIAIRNTSQPVQIENGQIETSKGDKRNHGYGLGNIRYLLDKLGGEYTFDYDDGWFQFVAEIPVE